MKQVATTHVFPQLEEMNSLLARISSDIIKAEPADMKEFPPLFTRVNDARSKVVELIWELDTEETQHDEIAVKTKINEIANMVLDLMEDLRGFYATK